MQKVKRNIMLGIAFAVVFTANAQPSWKFDAEQSQYKYQNSMTITAQLHIDGEISLDSKDMIGIFYGDECRGAACNDYEYNGQKYSLITVYGNGYGEEELRIKISLPSIVKGKAHSIVWPSEKTRIICIPFTIFSDQEMCLSVAVDPTK